MDNLRERLGRVRHLIGSPPAEVIAPVSTTSTSSPASSRTSWALPPRYHQLAMAIDGDILHREAGSFCKKIITRSPVRVMPLRDELLFAAIADADPRSETLLWPETSRHSEIQQESIAFVDTETTGLGGSGAVPFVIGIGWYRGESFAVDQYLLPDYSDEAAMLEAVREDLARASAVVTYNGASFDIPLLRDRFVLHRIEREFQPANHLDLLHLSRRVFKRRLRDCSLGNLERAVLGHERVGDTPGYLIPATYFEWLNSERAESLVGVLAHNADDIVSLAALYQFLQRAVRSSGESLDRSEDIYGLSRFFQRRRREDQEVRALELIHRERASDECSAEMSLAYARRLKLAGDITGAVALWEEIASRNVFSSLSALRHLAMVAEHRSRDYAAALSHARRGIQLLGDLHESGGTIPQSVEADFLARKNRLERRLLDSSRSAQ